MALELAAGNVLLDVAYTEAKAHQSNDSSNDSRKYEGYNDSSVREGSPEECRS